ncbi:tRNA (guanine(37)-N1)-methyltransferase [Bufo gargarizans]|uniref:tRNA (guanine(37)-N1)-methyltransferase n=1 Tax=Bufo gargarizans TaxID=30331 RepID=UPI001CF4CD2E|nr:tRNA (guanine(37)-N1)-methyltransferase [Bufo gargarizans]
MRLIRQCYHSAVLLNSYGFITFNKLVWNQSKQWFCEPYTFRTFQKLSGLAMMEIKENSENAGLFCPNPSVRGMVNLDRDAFSKTIQVPVLKIRKEIINKVMKTLKHKLIHRPHVKRISDDPEDDSIKNVILDPFIVSSEDSFDDRDRESFKQLDISPQVLQVDLQLTYENFKTDEILEAVLPKGQDVTSSFSRIGHIAHMNLRDHQLPYKNLIGQVILDKNPGLTSVVNKTNIIDSTYRNFQMEVLAGEENMMTKVKENGFTYEFDFSKVYWNSRLSTEHDRIAGFLKNGDVVFDVFAGVGPFAIPAARRNCIVYANDLNPESYKWLVHNCKLNKVDKKVQAFNTDGREFIRTVVKEELSKYIKSFSTERKHRLHIVMNLPALALEFLDTFRHLLPEESHCEVVLPTVHCYGFSKDDNPEKEVKDRAEEMLGTILKNCSIHLVRKVAPNKEMMCISFELPAEVLFGSQTINEGEPVSKRPRTDEGCSEAQV